MDSKISRWQSARRSAGFTLIEIMVATVITLILMGSVAAMFGFVSTSVTDSRAMAEAGERLRNVRAMLQHDLQGITAYGTPPLSPDMSRGYLEYIEGPQGALWRVGIPSASPGAGAGATQMFSAIESPWDDCDDILMFTTRSTGEPYLGRFYDVYGNYNFISSPTAEVAWFARGTTLFRRILLVLPNQDLNIIGSTQVPYYFNDVSMHQMGGSYTGRAYSIGTPNTNNPKLIANSLSDLTNRENRYAHQPLAWPYDARFWNWAEASSGSGASLQGTGVMSTSIGAFPNLLGLPTLQESSSSNFPFPLYGPDAPTVSRSAAQYVQTLFGYYILPAGASGYPSNLGKNSNQSIYPGHWGLYGGTANPDPVIMTLNQNGLSRFSQTSSQGQLNAHYSTGTNPPRFDDVVLTGVVGFDVKIWDPGAPVFQMTATIGGTSGYTSVAPGDPYYIRNGSGAVERFDGNPQPGNTSATLGSVGAYVDLNYMTNPATNTNLPGYVNYYSRYLTALNTYEANAAVKATTTVSGLTAYPGYSIPRPRFATEGDLPITAGSGTTYGPPFAYPGCPPIMRGFPSGAVTGGWVKAVSGGYTGSIASVYDTWSTHYESDGVDQDQDGNVDEGTDGIDNPYSGYPWNNPPTTLSSFNVIGGVDDPSELEAAPPYATGCKGLQIRIRIIEPGSRQIREVTVIQELLDE
jgi:prepilin-type N-terminal cleavage/methylation domain-containing protein